MIGNSLYKNAIHNIWKYLALSSQLSSFKYCREEQREPQWAVIWRFLMHFLHTSTPPTRYTQYKQLYFTLPCCTVENTHHVAVDSMAWRIYLHHHRKTLSSSHTCFSDAAFITQKLGWHLSSTWWDVTNWSRNLSVLSIVSVLVIDPDLNASSLILYYFFTVWFSLAVNALAIASQKVTHTLRKCLPWQLAGP